MLTIRAFEQRIAGLHAQGHLPGTAHLSIGQEAVAVGVCAALRADDYIASTHRGHGHALAKGAAPAAIFAELLGKDTGLCKGRGGSMHIADPGTGNLGANGIVGAGAGLATGAAFAAKYLKSDRVAVCFFGEGALGAGLVYEEMNMAQLWRLPVIFACENNQYQQYTHYSESTAGDVLDRAKSFGLLAEAVDGQDVRAVFAAATRVVDRARRGQGPSFLRLNTYRYEGHDVADTSRGFYRPESEEHEWRTQRDPLDLLAASLLRESIADAAVLTTIEQEISAELDDALRTASAAAYPDPSRLTDHLHA